MNVQIPIWVDALVVLYRELQRVLHLGARWPFSGYEAYEHIP